MFPSKILHACNSYKFSYTNTVCQKPLPQIGLKILCFHKSSTWEHCCVSSYMDVAIVVLVTFSHINTHSIEALVFVDRTRRSLWLRRQVALASCVISLGCHPLSPTRPHQVPVAVPARLPMGATGYNSSFCASSSRH